MFVDVLIVRICTVWVTWNIWNVCRYFSVSKKFNLWYLKCWNHFASNTLLVLNTLRFYHLFFYIWIYENSANVIILILMLFVSLHLFHNLALFHIIIIIIIIITIIHASMFYKWDHKARSTSCDWTRSNTHIPFGWWL